jgi:hypothetical protein
VATFIDPAATRDTENFLHHPTGRTLEVTQRAATAAAVNEVEVVNE